MTHAREVAGKPFHIHSWGATFYTSIPVNPIKKKKKININLDFFFFLVGGWGWEECNRKQFFNSSCKTCTVNWIT